LGRLSIEMSLITRILLLVLAVPFVLAHGDDDCGKGQFKWDAKNTCLPKGGPNKPSTPPAGSDCPFNWSWNNGKGCCAPHQPPSNLPPPQCPNGWKWIAGFLRCTPPPPTTPTPTKPSKPSQTPERGGGDPDCDDDKDKGKGGDKPGRDGDNHKRAAVNKRENRSRSVAPCPKGLSACPFSSLIGGDYECVDTIVDLDNCGGCATLGEGQNCNAIPGVWNVGCEQSACKIYTCAEGFRLSGDGKSCRPL